MGILSLLGGLFGLVGDGVKGFFGVKTAQAQVIQTAIQTLGQLDTNDVQRANAVAQIMVAEATSQYWLAACWRPLMMIIFLGIVISFWFGYCPPHFNDPMTPMMGNIFDLIKLSMGVGIGGRSLEKIATSINLGGIVKQLVSK